MAMCSCVVQSLGKQTQPPIALRRPDQLPLEAPQAWDWDPPFVKTIVDIFRLRSL